MTKLSERSFRVILNLFYTIVRQLLTRISQIYDFKFAVVEHKL